MFLWPAPSRPLIAPRSVPRPPSSVMRPARSMTATLSRWRVVAVACINTEASRLLCTIAIRDEVEHHAAAMWRRAVLEEVDALPRSQHHFPTLHGNGELRQRERGADVCRHIVRPFAGVA